MKHIFASLALGASLMLGANKAVDEAKTLMKDKKFEEAVAVLDPAIKAAPKDVAVKTAMVDALLGNGDVLGFANDNDLGMLRQKHAHIPPVRRVIVYDQCLDHRAFFMRKIDDTYHAIAAHEE